MTWLFREILLLAAQHAIFLMTLAQLFIFIAMGSLFRAKRDAAPRYIAGVLQLFVINGIACFSVLWGFMAFLATYTLSFVWHFKSGPKILQQFGDESDKNTAVSEDGEETEDTAIVENIDDLDRYENTDDTDGGAR
jgi:hypothetical protein